MRKLAFLCGLVVFALDQATKQWALGALSDGQTVPLLGKFLSLHLVFNPGAAFSIGIGATWIFTLVAALAVCLLPVAIFRTTPKRALLIGTIWGAAGGNLLDRLVREPGFPNGHVVDFINYNGWFIGNVADIAIVLGVLGFVLAELFDAKADKTAGVGEVASEPEAGQQ